MPVNKSNRTKTRVTGKKKKKKKKKNFQKVIQVLTGEGHTERLLKSMRSY